MRVRNSVTGRGKVQCAAQSRNAKRADTHHGRRRCVRLDLCFCLQCFRQTRTPRSSRCPTSRQLCCARSWITSRITWMHRRPRFGNRLCLPSFVLARSRSRSSRPTWPRSCSNGMRTIPTSTKTCCLNSSWSASLCRNFFFARLCVSQAANYLDVKPLLDLCCARVASMIKGMLGFCLFDVHILGSLL